MESTDLDLLFKDTSYKKLTYEFGPVKQDLYALETSATEYDLTGQIVW